jgi:hypothetical protein
MAPATSLPLACSIPSIPGDEFTATTTGPRLERNRSTLATLRPSTLGCTHRRAPFLLRNYHRLSLAAAMQVGAELTHLARALITAS